MSSGGSAGEEPGAAEKVVRTVTPPYRGHGDSEMNTIGFGYLAILLILLVPLLPFMVIAWAIGKVLDAVSGDSTD